MLGCTRAAAIAGVVLVTYMADVMSVTPTPEMPPFTLHTTTSGTEFGLTLPHRTDGISGGAGDQTPRLAIVLASTINETLGRVVQSGCPTVFYFANACPWLVAQGWACASLDLPSHGNQLLPNEPTGGITGWRWRMDRGLDFVAQSQSRIEDMVSYLTEHHLASADGIFIGGISRGGFLAAQYAAHAPAGQVASVGLLSPVTNLSLLTEFAHENKSMQEILRPLDVERQAASLASKNVFAIIGDEDPRVFTDSCVRAVRAIQCHGCNASGPYLPQYSCSGCPIMHGDTQLRVYREPNGHTVPPHEDPASTFVELASWVLRVTDNTKHAEPDTVRQVMLASKPPSPTGNSTSAPVEPLSALSRTQKREACALNGAPDPSTKICKCDAGWKGPRCAELNVAPAPSDGRYGLHDPNVPTWGGGAVFEEGHWHLIVGARAIASANDSVTDYPCDSKIVRAISAGSDVAGPYEIVETLFNRTTWEPGITRSPAGELVLMFFGNLSNPPPVGSAACAMPSMEFNLTTTNTYISVSKSGSVRGPWTTPILVRGMENRPKPELQIDGYSWSCASGNPSPAYHPNGTLFAAMRQNPCWKGHSTREHIGLWRADDGWDGKWTLVNNELPIYGWGGGSEEDCTDENGCPSHEDPHLWWDDEGGAHLLTHDQNNHAIHSTRGAYGWSSDGLSWTLETPMFEDAVGSDSNRVLSNASAWPMVVAFDNYTVRPLARRQRPSLIVDPKSRSITHVMQGSDFLHHHGPGGRSWCDGCHWGSGFTLIQPVAH